MRASMVLLPGDQLSLAELCAAELDGLVAPLGEGFLLADAPEDAVARAVSIRSIIPAGTAARGPSAAWVHGAGLRAPWRHHAQRLGPKRGGRLSHPRLRFHDTHILDSEWHLIGPLPVTSLARTLHDLVFVPDDFSWARALVAEYPQLPKHVADALRARARVPGKNGALERLAQLGDFTRT